MNFLALFAAVFAIGCAVGFAFDRTLTAETVAAYEVKIEQANDKAATVLAAVQADVKQAEADATINAIQLEDEHVKSNKINTDLQLSLANIRLLRKSSDKPRCSGPGEKNSDSGIPQDTAASIEFSERLNRLIDTNAKLADDNTEYARRAYEWAQSIDKDLILETSK